MIKALFDSITTSSLNMRTVSFTTCYMGEAMLSLSIGLIAGIVGGFLMRDTDVGGMFGFVIAGLPLGLLAFIAIHWAKQRRDRMLMAEDSEQVLEELKNLDKLRAALSRSGLGRSFGDNKRGYLVTTPESQDFTPIAFRERARSLKITIEGASDEDNSLDGFATRSFPSPESKCSQLNAIAESEVNDYVLDEDALRSEPKTRPESVQSNASTSSYSIIDRPSSSHADEIEGELL
jgi:hypothetical protein